MNEKKYSFLVSVVGIDGAKALMKAAERAAELDQAIFPRTILAWLEAVAPLGFEGVVPGVPVPFEFSKSETGFNGSIAVDGELHRFEAASINHLAGCVAVALGLDHERVSPQAKPDQIAKLGKSIDLLVKSQIVKAQLKPAGKKKIQLPGMAAQPIAPKGPVGPTAVQPTNQKQAPAGAAGTAQATSLPKLPKLPMPKKTASVTKSEAQKKCPHCMRPQFNGDKFVGCFCFSSLAKHVDVILVPEGYRLEFGRLWDQDAVMTLLQTFKK